MPENSAPGGAATKKAPHGQTDPGPAPVGPAVHEPPQKPAETPKDPGPAPVGPAVHPERS
jgi:hypothetical protein